MLVRITPEWRFRPLPGKNLHAAVPTQTFLLPTVRIVFLANSGQRLQLCQCVHEPFDGDYTKWHNCRLSGVAGTDRSYFPYGVRVVGPSGA